MSLIRKVRDLGPYLKTLIHDDRAEVLVLTVWQVLRADPDGRTVDYGLYATEAGAEKERDRLSRAYPEDADRLYIHKREVEQ